jgi:AcrR family transcriptional regulator
VTTKAKVRGGGHRGRRRRELEPVMRKRPRTPIASTSVEAIVDAAERLLERDGTAGLTTNRVAEHAGVSIGTLYQYFPNKFALAAAVFERHGRVYEQMFVAAVSAHRTPQAIICAVGDSLLEMFARRPRIHRSLRELRSASEVHERIDAMLRTMVDRMAGILAATQGIPVEHARDIAFVIVHGADGVANAIAASSDREQGRRVIAVFAEMVAAFFARA